MTKFILGSASPRRLELLNQIGFTPDEIISAGIDETPLKQEAPTEFTKRITLAKLEAVAKQVQSDDVILTADTIVVAGRKILFKTDDENQARKHLEFLSGRRHRVYTAICVRGNNKIYQKLVETRVKLKRLTGQEINEYINSGEWKGKAGGYGIQGKAGAFVIWLNGSYHNVVGLPLYETRNLLLQCSI